MVVTVVEQRSLCRRHAADLPGPPSARVVTSAANWVRVVWAPGARNAADDRIVDLVSTAVDPASVRVITSDRELAERVQDRGATVRGSGSFLDELSG